MRGPRSFLLCLWVVLLGACGEDPVTELILVTDTDMRVGTEIDRVRYEVIGTSGQVLDTAADLIGPEPKALPLLLGLTPRGNALGPIRVTAIGELNEEDRVRRTARVTFVRGRSLTLRLDLIRRCVGVMCGSTEQTCTERGCSTVDVSEAALLRWTGDAGEPVVDAGADAFVVPGEDAGSPRMDSGMDGGRPDAGTPMDDADVPADGPEPRPDTGVPDSGQGGECQSSAQCSDGIYCNGVEVCVGTPSMCQAGSDPCPGMACNESSQICEQTCSPSPEICDGLDNDCDLNIDENIDLSSDTDNCGACGNACAFLNAGAFCSGGNCLMGACLTGFVDLDREAFNGCEYPCTSTGSEVCDDVDNDCSGFPDDQPGLCGTGFVCVSGTCTTCSMAVDDDLDGSNQCDDCDDMRAFTYPGATELCDSFDNDCDGMIDEGTVPTTEVCDDLDNDCDGSVDEGVQQACYTGPGGTETEGLCMPGNQVCNGGSWGACLGEVVPVAEICDGQDNNCDGQVDEGCA